MGCANKCSFCWRQNSNPTIKEWNFATDPPVQLVEDMLDMQRSLVKNVSGMPGVTQKGYSDALVPRHCALSLVGEPIMYPRISEFCDELHRRSISSFLVNNGQFPECIEKLRPITQLYLSVDAANEADMKRLDRPIFQDFWRRFNDSVDLMRCKHGRTVFRMTLIKGWNMDDLDGYVDAVVRGFPDFIELKQVTPTFQKPTRSTMGCSPPTPEADTDDKKKNISTQEKEQAANKPAAALRMHNVPPWEEVIAFSEALVNRINKYMAIKAAEVAPLSGRQTYSIAAIHEHSKCVLIARRAKFYNHDYDNYDDLQKAERNGSDSAVPLLQHHARRGRWMTWIDYPKFEQLISPFCPPRGLEGPALDRYIAEEVTSKLATDKLQHITATDFMLPTPLWGVAGAPEEGFDPIQTRYRTAKYLQFKKRERQQQEEHAAA